MLKTLLLEHIVRAAAVLKAVKARDTSRAGDAERWRAVRHALRVCLREKSPHLAVAVTRHDHD